VLTSAQNDFVECLNYADLYALMGPESQGFARWSDATALAEELGGIGTPYPDQPLTITAPEDGAYAYLGSSSWVSLAADEPLLDPQKRTMTFNHVVPERFVPTATMQAGGASLEWIADVLAPSDGPERFDRLERSAKDAAAATEGLLFLPYLLGERSPYWNPHARGVFLGLAKHHTSANLVRAVLEGVAMNLLIGLRAFQEQGAAIEQVDAIGGGARSDLWLQVLADVWNVPVRRRSLVEEANSLGAAVVTGVAIGSLPDFGVASTLSELGTTFEPDPERHAAYAPRVEQFVDAYARLEDLFQAL
jgi:xylulokinase